MSEITPLNTGYKPISKIGDGGCQHYCQNGRENHTCGRSDIVCNNFKNCNEEHQKKYVYQVMLYKQRLIWKEIKQNQEDISGIL